MTGQSGTQFFPMLPGRTTQADMVKEQTLASNLDVNAKERKRKEAEARGMAISKLPGDLADVSMPGGQSLGGAAQGWLGDDAGFHGRKEDWMQGADDAIAIKQENAEQKRITDMAESNLNSRDKLLKEQEMKYNSLMSKASDPSLSDGMRALYQQQADSLQFEMRNTKMAVSSAANTQASMEKVGQMQRASVIEQENSEKALWGPLEQAAQPGPRLVGGLGPREAEQQVALNANRSRKKLIADATQRNIETKDSMARYDSLDPLSVAASPLSSPATIQEKDAALLAAAPDGYMLERITSDQGQREIVNRELNMAGVPPLNDADWERVRMTPSFQRISSMEELLMMLHQQWAEYQSDVHPSTVLESSYSLGGK